MDPVKILQEYIGIRTDHPNPDYATAVSWLKRLAESMNFETQTIELIDDKVALLVYLRGEDSTKPAILLNSHIDVVKVDYEHWKHDPWAAIIEDGKMYGRGTQDMKSLGIQHLFACKRLKTQGFIPKQDVVMSFVPEEEVMGTYGMNLLVRHLPPILFALDEGLPSPSSTINLYHSERKTWWLKVECFGNTGHGSKYIPDKDNAVIKLKNILDRFILEVLIPKEEALSGEELAQVMTINPTYSSFGSDKFYNVIPSKAELGLDVRIPVETDLRELFLSIQKLCLELGDENVKVSFQHGTDYNCFQNPISDNDEYIQLITDALASQGLSCEVKTFPASTDARYLRFQGIPTFGISVIRNCEVLLHDHNEYIPIDSFLEGIHFYEQLLILSNNSFI